MPDRQTKSTSGLAVPLFIAVIALVATACWVIARGSDLPGKPKLADRPVVASDVFDFKTLYSANCAGCHGPDGEYGAAPPLDDGTFRTIVPEEVLTQVISAGRPGTPMPGFDQAHGGPLTAEQIQVLVYQIKGEPYRITSAPASGRTEVKRVDANDSSNVKTAWELNPAPNSAPPYLGKNQPSAATGVAASAMALFKTACAKCHGAHGEGSDAGAINGIDFLALASDQMLRRIIITGRADVGMPAYDDPDRRGANYKPLTSDEIDQLVALLAEWRHVKTGNTSANAAALHK